MLRRSIWEIRSIRRIPTQITTQIPSYLSSRKEYSSGSPKNAPQGPGSTGKPPESGNHLSKLVIGSVALGAAALTAYQTGYVDKLLGKDQHSSIESSKIDIDNKHTKDLPTINQEPTFQESNISIPSLESTQNNIETHSDSTHLEDSSNSGGKYDSQLKDVSELIPEKDITPIQEDELVSSSQSSVTSDNLTTDSTTPVVTNLDTHSQDVKANIEKQEAAEVVAIFTQANAISKAEELMSKPPVILDNKKMPEDAPIEDTKQPSSLLDEYHLEDKDEDSAAVPSLYEHKDVVEEVEKDGSVHASNDGKLVLDFLQAIHTAEKRQEELDAHIFSEEKRMMKEKYEQELKDARARELMYAEREAILDKELNKEKLKAAAALKSLQEKLEEKLKLELEQKESEAELELKKIQDMAKAELAAAIASEKASQIEKMAEANLHINALCMAFYARSEESRQSHSVHKLALGALALEDALSKGLPIKKEIDALGTYVEGVDKDSLLTLVLSSLPEETRNYGTDTLLQLNNKFDALKGTLRHFSLIPPAGGGILTHSFARIATMLKVREVDQSGDGIESIINRVESFLAEGKLLEAADTLEGGLKDSKAAEIVTDWVTRARNRAITEQALTVLQSYATSVSLTY